MKEKRPGRPLVLVVEDFQDAREMYALYLGYEGFGVIQAKDGFEALKLAGEQLPDLILMDLALPGMDGWEATRRIKDDPRTRHIPVVALTGHVLAGHAEGAVTVELGYGRSAEGLAAGVGGNGYALSGAGSERPSVRLAALDSFQDLAITE